MEHESEPRLEQANEGPGPGDNPGGCGSVILKLVAGAIVVFFVAVALVFGVCLLG